jgi:microtubule-associated protein-like 1/2
MDFHAEKNKFALGMNSGFIMELGVESKTTETIMWGHCGEIWGLAVHPNKPIIITGSLDLSVRIWDYSERKQIRKVKCKKGVRSAAFSPSGDTFVLGLYDGTVELHEMDKESPEPKFTKKFRNEMIDAISFSPDGKLISAGSWDQKIEIIGVNDFNSVHSLKGHSSSILSLTWSTDSKYLISNSKDYDILYWSVATGKTVGESVCLELEWDNWSNILGWPVVGIFKEGNDGTDVNAASISGDFKTEYRVIATGDDSQNVNLYRFPALQPRAPGKTFSGHSSHVTRVRFSPDSSFLFSTGGLDYSIFQWKHHAETKQ